MSGRLVDFERDALIVACAASAGVHAALVPGHFAERVEAGWAFLASAGLLAGLAAMLTRRPASLAVLSAAGTVLAGLLVGYALAITTGVPLIHPETETVAGLALATKAIEAAGLLAALHLLGRGRIAHVTTFVQQKGTQT